ncbi:MAG: hypothetical protein V1820_02050 [archaeon]
MAAKRVAAVLFAMLLAGIVLLAGCVSGRVAAPGSGTGTVSDEISVLDSELASLEGDSLLGAGDDPSGSFDSDILGS